jgi:environmental stress-induced protein Ves
VCRNDGGARSRAVHSERPQLTDSPGLHLIDPTDYARVPWKNGGGITQDVLLLPAGSGHDDFDVRISLAPIVEEGPFSSFPGIDRRITRLSREPVSLDFADREVALERLVPVHFDSVLAPISRLADGPARVINVMTRRGRFEQSVETHQRWQGRLDVGTGQIFVVHAVTGPAMARSAGRELMVGEGATLIASGPVEFEVAGHGEMLIAKLTRL